MTSIPLCSGLYYLLLNREEGTVKMRKNRERKERKETNNNLFIECCYKRSME
jgi:hypothetical protein